MERTEQLKNVKRIVIKIGSSSLTHNGRLNKRKINRLVHSIAVLMREDIHLVLVSSGAVSSGIGELQSMHRIKKTGYPTKISEKQAAASIGQSLLMHYYASSFRRYTIPVGQILLTENDFENREHYLNIRNTLCRLFDYGTIPIVNENDTVGITEILFGDNDTLAALVADMIQADILIVLTDIDGFYMNGELQYELHHITDEVEQAAGSTGSSMSRGGMMSKIAAAKQLAEHGTITVIANSNTPNVIQRILSGEVLGTYIHPSDESLSCRKRWLKAGAKSKGKIIIDAGAVTALCQKKKSLLPSGIISIEGSFETGMVVDITNQEGVRIGRGLVNYSSAEIERLRGKKTFDIEHILGYKRDDEIILRDNIIIFKEGV